MTYETVEARGHGELQSCYVWKKPFTFPCFFKSGLLQSWKRCVSLTGQVETENLVWKLPLEITLDASSVPPWEVLQESGDPCPPPPASELVALYPNLWLLVDQGDLDPVDLVVGASSGSP